LSSYSYKEALFSCSIDKSILEDIESYLKNCVEQHDSNADLKKDYRFDIIDPLGTESFESVSGYTRSTFPNDIESVSLSYRAWGHSINKIYLSLGKEKYRTNLEIEISAPSAKATALGIAEEIKRRLGEKKNINFIFHSWFDLIVPWVMAIFGMVSILYQDKEGYVAITACFFAAVVLCIFWIIIKRSSPYCEFDTLVMRSIESGRRWLLFGVLGAVIFGGVARLIWQ
jgi:hypothetical protein